MKNKEPYIKEGMLNPDMPTQELRLHCGELTDSEVRLARAIIKWANSVIKENMVGNKTVELKPCPFCSKPVELDGSDWMGWGIYCPCQIYPFNTTKEAAISAWNTRTPTIDPALVSEMVELVKSLELELVQGDSINRTNPNSLQKVNSNGSWLVTKDYRAAHKAKTILEKISSILARLGYACEDEGCPHYGTKHSHKEGK